MENSCGKITGRAHKTSLLLLHLFLSIFLIFTTFNIFLLSFQTVWQAGVLDVEQPVLALFWSRPEVAGDVGVDGEQEESEQEEEQEEEPVPVGADAGATARDGKTPFAQGFEGGRGKLNHLSRRDRNCSFDLFIVIVVFLSLSLSLLVFVIVFLSLSLSLLVSPF